VPLGDGPLLHGQVGFGRAVVGTVLRSCASVVVLLVVYYAAPLDRALTPATGLVFVTALVLFGGTVAFEVRGILGSERPRLRAIRALAVGVPLLLVVFASAYSTVAAQQSGAFTESLNRTDALYFTVTVFSTVGFGDISAQTELARILVTIQMVVGLLTVGVIAKVVFGAVHVAETRRRAQPDPSGVPGADRL
jgi:voltage-gated potassium channel